LGEEIERKKVVKFFHFFEKIKKFEDRGGEDDEHEAGQRDGGDCGRRR
jgi:hypothetical protein